MRKIAILRDDIKIFFKKIKCGYHIKNYREREENKKALKESRLKYTKSTENPLVSVLIPTYNRSDLLIERTIPSVLRQTYQNFELIVVGDHCTDDTEKKLRFFNDKRIKFFNLPQRGNYPEDPHERWMVAGVTPANKAIELSSGDWIAPLDDDDEFSDDHIETLLKFATGNDYEMVYGKVHHEVKPNEWGEVGSYPLERGSISRMSALYSSKLKFIKYDINCWEYSEPADFNMWRKMVETNVKIGFIDEFVGNHYLERNQKNK